MSFIVTLKNEREYLECSILNDYNLVHGFTMKNDEEITYEKVVGDYKLNDKFIKIDEQAHSGLIKIISSADEYVTNVDGLITNKKNIPLFIRTADCISVILYDKKNKVIGNIHSGWKGTICKIIKNAVNLMKSEFNSSPEDIIACFFPSIGYCHFEVDEDVKDKFKETFKDLNNIDNYIRIGEKKEGKQKYYVDTISINKELLFEEGILLNNMYKTNYCTVCENSRFYSHRMKDERRNLTFIEMRD